MNPENGLSFPGETAFRGGVRFPPYWTPSPAEVRRSEPRGLRSASSFAENGQGGGKDGKEVYGI